MRKQPRQQRSMATVHRIVDAGARILVERGYDGASTNRIAEAAGLSPGSIYQYFRDKDAIVLAVVDRLVGDVSERIVGASPLTGTLPMTDLAREVITRLIDALTAHAELIAALLDRVPRLGGRDLFHGLVAPATELTYLQLTTNRSQLHHDNLETTTWFVVQTTSHLALRYVIDRPPIPQQQFIEELTHMLIGYAYRRESAAGD